MTILRWIALSCLFWAQWVFATPYQDWVQEIEQRLDKTAQLYEKNEVTEAKNLVQMAYFEVFENLEGPIRINFSAQKSYQMEATFGEIRKMIQRGESLEAVQAKINGLKAELQAVLPALEQGHQLNANAPHLVKQNPQIAPHWQQSFQTIDDLLALAMSAYEAQDFKQAKKLVQQAQYDGFKNSEMEMAIRQFRVAAISGNLNQQFYDLIKLSEKPDQISQFGYQITLLLQDIEAQLPNLPTTRDTQNTIISQSTDSENIKQDWELVRSQILQDIKQAISLYQQGEVKNAVMLVQNTYFDVFEQSQMEAKIGSRESQFKAQLEGYFTHLVSLMNANAELKQLQAQENSLAQDLDRAVAMLQSGDQGGWSLFLYSLLIIVREGLEALLIVAAIVAFLVKNQHQEKLPLIRHSVGVALLASIITAFIFQLIFENSGQNREILEGFTMIFAVVMLFMMSYWLLSKVEAQNWKRYLEGKLTKALSTGSLIGLWLTSFLAVYREGAETVLFYYALIGDIENTIGYLYLISGFMVGILILLICYWIMRYSVLKLPLKPFFMFTGSLMYFMAFVFAGKSILELIEGKLFEPTLIPHIPQIQWLGIYPYWETLIPQIILLTAAFFAWCYLKRSNKKAV